ncbi:unnamed protein product [Brachionus calyciflorus]|uniref:C-type lectin domain-containing protein n=1 Tax=Brachionus calyciflorus TaxID=104777 RepID=A0A814PF12_9BILA|nr:unnamed protein product [Brachionus calyciflorus]
MTNEELYKIVKQIPITEELRKRQLKFIGHRLRMPIEESANIYALYQSKVRERNKIVRPSVQYIEQISKFSTNDSRVKLTIAEITNLFIQCYYAIYNKNECSLFTIDAKIDTILLSDTKIYQKIINDLLDEDIGMITIQNVLREDCSNSDLNWSLTTNTCLPGKTRFMNYSEMPNSCYHKESGWKNFEESKVYCESKGAFLFRPKTQRERLFFTQKFPNLIVFVDSRITRVGQRYKWPDGSCVFILCCNFYTLVVKGLNKIYIS